LWSWATCKKTANTTFGKQLAETADYVFVVGEVNKQALVKGLISGGVVNERIIEVENREQAAEQLALVASPGCVVLFENDLPSNY